eukprot:COSAG01_NODE_7131_length_3336_cov_957.309546_5_plen_59_part_00
MSVVVSHILLVRQELVSATGLEAAWLVVAGSVTIGESLLPRVQWVAVPEAMRPRRVNK